MAIYVALLRGINVGGKNKIKMAELRQKLEAIGLNRVQTYIQSGNVLFEANEEEQVLRQRIEEQIEAGFGIKAAVALRTADEIRHVAANCPFSEEAVTQAQTTAVGESLHVSFLLAEPAQEAVERLEPYKSDNDEYRIIGREMYLLFHHSIRDSKLAMNLHKLNVAGTVRNWKTVNKLVALADAMESP
ncbi:DUF1697 domain-containing protein [Paenibacillus piri]|uniref:DUF1697 domain-containing protein n=1 Tax=Paenibacillus piri TaxID=2547395 RepID=A0A4R5KI13_9BACL|nr:DUF1697 domain-containing protein [Paenibacillus piri]TDF95101.1 DUF1697 domain-containing protein [Paenibacillus piri]